MTVHDRLLRYITDAPRVDPVPDRIGRRPDRQSRLTEVLRALDHLLADMGADDRRLTIELLAEAATSRWDDVELPLSDPCEAG